jgi:hypothetical protein
MNSELEISRRLKRCPECDAPDLRLLPLGGADRAKNIREQWCCLRCGANGNLPPRPPRPRPATPARPVREYWHGASDRT